MPHKTHYVPQIQDYAKEVAVGREGRYLCPCCNGGSSRERSLSITRRSNTEAFYICYRASCSLGAGHIALYSADDGSILRHNTFKKPTNNDLTHNLASLDRETVDFFMRKYYMTPGQLLYGRFQTTFDRRIYMWIFGPRRLKRGGCVRKYAELYTGRRELTSIPKNLVHFNGTDDKALSWYFKDRHRKRNSKDLIIVEDIPSALRLNSYCDSVSLIGTGLGSDKQKEIRSMGYDRIYLALDEDATAKALKIKKSCSLYLSNMRVIPLSKDIKDTPPEELEEVLHGSDIL